MRRRQRHPNSMRSVGGKRGGTIFSLVFVGIALCSGPVFAQTCRGGVSFADYPGQVGFSAASFSSGETNIRSGLLGGGPRGFGQVAVGFAIPEEALLSNYLFVGAGGAGTLETGRVSVCPGGNVFYSFGPDVESLDATIRVLEVGGGVDVGVVAWETPSFQLIPTAGFGISRLRATASVRSAVVSDSAVIGVVAAGIGLVFNHKIALRPIFSFPVSGGDNSLAFSIVTTFGFGR